MTEVILIMAGGTGGHVFPGLAVASELTARGYEVQWLGSEQGIENRLVPSAGYPLHRLAVTGIRGKKGIRMMLGLPWMLLCALASAWRVLREVRPVVVLGFGGFASGPGGIAARLQGIPLVVHEQNATAGFTNRVLANLATRVLEGFGSAFGRRATVVGNPVRRGIVELPDPDVRYGARQGALRVMILGGSQGSRALNTRAPAALLSAFGDVPVDVLHQCGAGRATEARSSWPANGWSVEITEFVDDMTAAYRDADLVVCRSGALTVAEVAAAGVAAVFVPLPSAVDDHQTANARWLSDAGAAILIPEAILDGPALAAALPMPVTREALQSVATRARQQALVQGAVRVADICEEVIRG